MPTINLGKPKRDNVRTVRKGKYQEIYQDKRWKKLRSAKMRYFPLCEMCSAKQKVTPTAEVHHVVPFGWGRNEEEIEGLAFNYDNLISVCVTCHKEAHRIIEDRDLMGLFLKT
jgi:5-methylcytosine-specific restriction protein A